MNYLILLITTYANMHCSWMLGSSFFLFSPFLYRYIFRFVISAVYGQFVLVSLNIYDQN